MTGWSFQSKVAVALAILCGIAPLEMDYAYYEFLRIAVTIGGGFLIWASYTRQQHWAAIAIVAIVILFNPFSEFELERDDWFWFDIASAGLFAALAALAAPPALLPRAAAMLRKIGLVKLAAITCIAIAAIGLGYWVQQDIAEKQRLAAEKKQQAHEQTERDRARVYEAQCRDILGKKPLPVPPPETDWAFLDEGDSSQIYPRTPQRIAEESEIIAICGKPPEWACPEKSWWGADRLKQQRDAIEKAKETAAKADEWDFLDSPQRSSAADDPLDTWWDEQRRDKADAPGYQPIGSTSGYLDSFGPDGERLDKPKTWFEEEWHRQRLLDDQRRASKESGRPFLVWREQQRRARGCRAEPPT